MGLALDDEIFSAESYKLNIPRMDDYQTGMATGNCLTPPW
jgi:hypothetical protein